MIGACGICCSTSILFLFFVAAVGAAPSYSQSAGEHVYKIAKIEFAGLHQYTREQAVEASGLKEGGQIKLDDLQASANRLLASGLFKRASYRYAYEGENVEVTFEVEEQSSNVPVIFDNFVWFSDAELTAAIKSTVPSFSGVASESGPQLDAIKTALQKLLTQKGLPGTVEYLNQGDERGRHLQHIFTVNGVDFRICRVTFPGANPTHLRELMDAGKALAHTSYSRASLLVFGPDSLGPIYSKWGYLKASFGTPTASLEDEAHCGKNEVAVSIPVTEGITYKWKDAEWTGSTVFSSQGLDKLLGMKSGDVANGIRIASGFQSIREAYGAKGFIMAQVRPSTQFDDAKAEVTYHLSVLEGKQFHMGKLVVTALPEDDANKVRSLWKLDEGSVFDQSYMKEFIKKLSAARVGARSGKQLRVGVKPDLAKAIVDVVVGTAN